VALALPVECSSQRVPDMEPSVQPPVTFICHMNSTGNCEDIKLQSMMFRVFFRYRYVLQTFVSYEYLKRLGNSALVQVLTTCSNREQVNVTRQEGIDKVGLVIK